MKVGLRKGETETDFPSAGLSCTRLQMARAGPDPGKKPGASSKAPMLSSKDLRTKPILHYFPRYSIRSGAART